MDEKSESDPEFLRKLAQGKMQRPNGNKQLDCPKCVDVTLMRRFWSIKREIELDECAKCGGMWLDAGELTHIYSLYATEEERLKAASEYLDGMFGPDFKRLKTEAEEQTYRKVASVLQHISPSYYLRRLF